MAVNGELHAEAALPLMKKKNGIHWTGGWVGYKARLDLAVAKRKSLACRGSNPGRPTCTRKFSGLLKQVSLGGNMIHTCSGSTWISP
jgi:hypothetical protein